MILPDLILPSRQKQRWKYSGMDSLDKCFDQEHFQNYPYPIEYIYNSRGFRDAEWPDSLDELKNAIWCFGDSFTVGVGQPFEHTWSQVLSNRLRSRTINVSMDGASNDWIARKVLRVVDEIDPKNMVILWSYTHRTELIDDSLSDEDRRCKFSKNSSLQDLQHWISLTNKVKNRNKNVTQATIPNFHNDDSKPNVFDVFKTHWNNIKDPSWPDQPSTLNELENLPKYIKEELKFVHQCYSFFSWVLSPRPKVSTTRKNRNLALPDDIIYINKQLDRARDYHHFDILTAQWLVDRVLEHMGVADSSRIDFLVEPGY